MKSEQKIADALRNVANAAEREWDQGKRSRCIDLGDIIETLLAVADQLDPPVKKPRKSR